MTSKSPDNGADSDSRATGLRRGLSLKFFITTFPFVAAIALLTQVGIGYINYRDNMKTFNEEVRLITQLTAQAIARPVWNMDRSVYEPQIEAISRIKGFRYATLTDENHAPVFTIGEKPDEDEAVTEFEFPIKSPAGDIWTGRFVLIASTRHLIASANRQAVIGLVSFLVLLIGFSLIVHGAVRRLVARPLADLLQAMSQVERKIWQKAEVTVMDEIGQVKTAFNRMVDGLAAGDEAKRLLAELKEAQAALVTKNKQLDHTNRQITESIQYARRIQNAMLPDKNALGDAIKDIHVSWEPLHLVGGDYFWLERFGDQSLLVVADCTGHGVPGAFMTLVVASALDRILHERRMHTPSQILLELDREVRERLRQDRPDSDSDDGLEAAVCLLDSNKKQITFAGAGMPLIYVRNGRAEVIKGDRAFLGYRTLPAPSGFGDHVLEVEADTSFYLLTDGIHDQMGGFPRRLLGRKRLAGMILSVQGKSMAEQAAILQEMLVKYRGTEPLRDDMTLIGFVPF